MPRVIITLPGAAPQPYRFALDQNKIRIGRGSENDIVIDARSVSMHHAEIERSGTNFVLRDLGSTNGTRIGDDYRTLIDLAEPGRIHVGDVALGFELSDEEIATLSDEPQALPKLPQRDPAPTQPATAPRRRPRVEPDEEELAGSSSGAIFGLAVLAVIFLIVGASVRHHQETGRHLINELMSNIGGGRP